MGVKTHIMPVHLPENESIGGAEVNVTVCPVSNGVLCCKLRAILCWRCAFQNMSWSDRIFVRPFTVLYFFVRRSRSRASRYGVHLAWVSKLLTRKRAGVVWEEAGKRFSPPSPYRYNPSQPPPQYIWKSRWPPSTVRGAISQWSCEKIGDCEQSRFLLWIGTYCISYVVQQRSRVKDFCFLVGYDES